MRRRIAIAVIVATGLATAGMAYAENQPADPSVGPTAPAGAQAGGRPGGPGVLKGAIHGDLLIRGEDGATRTVTFDRGRITAVSAGSITIERADGVPVSKNFTDQTVFNGTPRDKLQAGTRVVVVSSGDTAERVVSKGARAERRRRQLENRQERLERRQDRREQRQERRERRQGDVEPSSGIDDGLETIPA